MIGARNTTTIIHLFEGKNDGIVNAVQRYEELHGVGPIWVIQVPARICLAADHTDYWPGFTSELVVMASDSQIMTAVIGPRDDGFIYCNSMDGEFDPWAKNLGENIPIGDEWLAWLEMLGAQTPHWSNYVMGSVRHTQMFEKVKLGFNMSITSTIPPDSGASSSSALAICGMFAIRLSNQLATDAEVMTFTTAEAEWFCGTRGGMMDHATMMYSCSDSVLKLTFNPFTQKAIELPKEMGGMKFATLFTHPSNKGGEIKRAFNELAFVAREVIPRLVPKNWQNNWTEVAEELPGKMSRQEITNRWPDDCAGFEKMYPDLFDSDFEIKVANRFRFAMRELGRSKRMQSLLTGNDCTAEKIGNIMNESWVDAGDLYDIRTPEMDQFANRARNIPGVHGIKVMGAGFGGNLLLLTDTDADLSSLGKERIQECSAGPASSIIDIEEMMPALDNTMPPLAAVLLCGGKGSRMLEQGITTHKPLLNLNGIPSTKLVIQQLLNSQLNFSQILVVVPPKREPDYEEALADLGVKIVTQHEALGTGNAVHCIIDELLSPIEQVYVSFGTQPLIRTTTIETALAHHLTLGAGFTLPTTLRKDPYAPLIRDEMGKVVGSIETHLDNAEMPSFGETNVGGYWSSKPALEIVLGKLHSKLYDEENKRYNTNSGELGFPNEMVKGCLEAGLGVEGIAIADPEEVVGLKTPEHIKEVEQWLNKGWRR